MHHEKKGKVRLNGEEIDFSWITRKDLQKYDLIAGIREEIYTVDDIINKRRLKNYFN